MATLLLRTSWTKAAGFCLRPRRVIMLLWFLAFLAFGMALVVSSSGSTASAAPPDLNRGIRAFEANRFRAALEDLLPLAQSGNPEAQFHVGVMAHDGLGRQSDRAEAAGWFRKSAQGGFAKSQFYYALMLHEGRGIPANAVEARLWYERAAPQGIASAMHNLGVMYEEGQGGAQDYVRAYMWYDLAIRAGASYSQEFQDRLPQVLLDREIEEARRLAAEWLRRNPQAMPSTLPRGKQASRTPEAVGAGTGFVVSASGHVVTSHHVVTDCERVRIRVTGQDREAKTIAWDPVLDLAIVKIDGWKGPTALLATKDPRAGDPVVVVGFPLPDKTLLAGESTITTGTLSSLVGLAGDLNTFQVTAPVQLGNSGGPILDRTGAVIGVVVAKLNAIAVARATGDLPQNINFGIQRRRVAEFLRIHRVDVRTRDSAPEMAVADIGDLAKSFTVPIQCLR